MPLDLSVIGKKTESGTFEYNWKDVIRYALGIGAQETELPFVFEGVAGGLKVFPSFAVIAGAGGMLGAISLKDVDITKMLHGEQSITLFSTFPADGKIVNVSEVESIWDKGKAAVMNILITGSTEAGDKVFESRASLFFRGEGGFGGDPGPKAAPLTPPEGAAPDFSVSYEVPKNQAALYRLNGDFNPLHIDPNFAKMGGFDTPILHGLCSYGYACRAIVYGLCDGDVSRFKEFKVRFTDVVFPGETITTKGWKDGDRYIIQCSTERAVVISNAYVKID